MFSVIKVRFQSPCSALYDNYGDKLIVSSLSSLSQNLTKEVEDHKMKLADKITREVYSEF